LQLEDTPSCNQQATNVAVVIISWNAGTGRRAAGGGGGAGRRAYRRAEGMLLWGGVLGVLGALVGQGVLRSMHPQTKIHMGAF
jgi:hypothetical protein